MPYIRTEKKAREGILYCIVLLETGVFVRFNPPTIPRLFQSGQAAFASPLPRINLIVCVSLARRLSVPVSSRLYSLLKGRASWLAIDLPVAVSLSSVELAFEDGDERTQDFEIVVMTQTDVRLERNQTSPSPCRRNKRQIHSK